MASWPSVMTHLGSYTDTVAVTLVTLGLGLRMQTISGLIALQGAS